MSIKPFFTVFKTSNCNYLYDGVTQNILMIDHITGEIINDYISDGKIKTFIRYKGQYDSLGLQDAVSEIEDSIKQGMLLSREIKKFSSFGTKKEIPQLFQSRCHQLILEVTRNCNMNCGYCIYSGLHQNYHVRSERNMSKITLKKAIEFYMKHSVDEESCYISFYGGEPLLKFNSIKYGVACANQLAGKKKVSFNITTNGTLLAEDKINFFVKNNFNITISIDGPKEIHDRYRILPTGEGTFEKIINNLKLIYNKYPEYYAQKILFSVVLAPPVDYRKLYKFFDNPLFRNSSIFSTGVDDPDGEFEKVFNINYPQNDNFSWLVDKYKQMIINNKKPNRFIASIFEKELSKIHQRTIFEKLPTIIHPNGICLPGTRRVFVDVDGTLHACERINRNMPLGDLEHGFDLEKIMEYIRTYQRISINDCKSCWAVRICSLCFQSSLGKDFSAENKRKYCESIKKYYKIIYSLYCSIREKNDMALHFLNSVKIG